MLIDPFLIKYPVVSREGMMGFIAQDNRGILKYMEESFADEISAFYYMNLCTDLKIRISESRSLDKSPRQLLSLILEQDKDKPLIKEWFCKWMEDLTAQQSDLLEEEQMLLNNFKAK